ncbi:MAG: DUF503 domain-containing protein [Deltaproteobacteria bacterium]|jgi:uncharacterized protein YlxP (DUF503 family)|nr:DUF503 domain-containing protein [Deltaproteobacteria bacterium]
MFVGILRLEFILHGNESLKDKRRVAQSLKQKLRSRFNVAVAEAGSENNMNRLSLALVSASNDKRHLEGRLGKCLNLAQAACGEELIYDDLEIIGTE